MKRRPLTLSHTKNMRLHAVGPAQLVTITRWRCHFQTSCMESSSGWHICQRWHGTNKAQGHLWKQGTVIGNDLMTSDDCNFCCGCATPNIVHATLVIELALFAQGEKCWSVSMVAACSPTCTKSMVVPSTSSSSGQQLWPSVSAYWCRAMLGQQGLDNRWHLLQKYLFEESRPTWSPPTKRRIVAGIERVSHLQGILPA